MKALRGRSPLGSLATLLSAALLTLLALPIGALILASSPSDIRAGIAHPMFMPALRLSLETTVASLAISVCAGTPLAWWLASSASRMVRVVEVVVELPIVVPPAVVGVALLRTFGRQGFLGPALASIDISIPFSATAVVMAQVVVSSPFFIQATANAFRKIDPDLLMAARTLGASPTTAFLRIALPIALPGIVVGACLAWARALGEFGATLLFAGNMSGATQTMPLAIFSALESDVRLAVVFSVVLAGAGGALLLLLRFALAPNRRTASQHGPERANGRPI